MVNGWLKSYKLDYKLEQESLSSDIDQALSDYHSKSGGKGGNRPDAKLLLTDKNLKSYPILIEYKGYKDKLVKLDKDGKVANKNAKNEFDFKVIKDYAVNGAVHYADAVLHYTNYTDIIAIGVTGYKNQFGKIEHQIGVYYVSKKNLGYGQKVDDYTDLSFLKSENFNAFIDKVKKLQLSQEELEKLKEHREREIEASLVKLNNDIYQNEKGLGENDRVYLVAAMNEMLIDAKNTIKSPDELKKKTVEIKAKQLLGLEILPGVYMLAILNMILMGDGSSNILNDDSLKFNGNYGFTKDEEKFPATAFVLNSPYSAVGNGMVFVEKALSMMEKGYAAIIIQSSAGSGKAVTYNRNILKHSTLLASIKMPIDLFIGKSSVQTHVYVFRAGEAHQKDDIVKFIDFSNDGYTRTNRRKANCNLFDTDRAGERYQEIIDLVRFGKSKLNIFTENEYFEGTVDPANGADWNQSASVDTKPTLEDFKKTVSD